MVTAHSVWGYLVARDGPCTASMQSIRLTPRSSLSQVILSLHTSASWLKYCTVHHEPEEPEAVQLVSWQRSLCNATFHCQICGRMITNVATATGGNIVHCHGLNVCCTDEWTDSPGSTVSQAKTSPSIMNCARACAAPRGTSQSVRKSYETYFLRALV